jgi:predicted signal transduction protein with EAL and GGDEF domain/DNA-binding response OmpR family regulator
MADYDMLSGGSETVPLILVVEDNPIERTLLLRLLGDAHFSVVGADCGHAALAQARQTPPDLILLDALLPDIDGFDVCVELRKSPQTHFIPIVMLTGLDDVTSINRAFEAGATDFFTKPINHTLLLHRLRYLLRASAGFEELRLSRKSLASAHRIAKLGHWELNLDKNRVTISEELQQLYHLDSARADNGIQGLLSVCSPADRTAVEQAIAAVIRDGGRGRVEHRVVSPDGTERVMEMNLAIVQEEDDCRRLLGISMDITARKETEREVLRLAYFDRLTGLPNRALLELILDQEIPRAHGDGLGVALICIDLDLFSRVNNAMGHSAGDAVLRQVAQRLRRIVSSPAPQELLERLSLTIDLSGDWSKGLAGRLGADTFGVLVTGPHAALSAQARALAQSAQQIFEQAFIFRGQELFITASMGISQSGAAVTPAEILLQQADMALREAKSQARSEIREYHGGLVTQVSSEMSIQSDMRRALLRGEFQVYYQPKVALPSGVVTGFEALIRWQHPARGKISPGEFINVAEEAGQIVEIGRWMLQAACFQFKQWLDRGLVQGRIAVNISARQFHEANVEDMVLTVLEQSGLAPKHLELEITEGVLMSEPRANEIITRLRERGISIALDDFGTGYSSLSYLTRFPIDTLKIDRCFVHDITHESEQAAIVTAVTSLSHRLNLKVIAEGVETESELQVISELSCDEVQGYLVCKPLSATDMESWLRGYISSASRRRSVIS